MRKLLGRTLMFLAPLVGIYIIIQDLPPVMMAIAGTEEADGALLRFFLSSALWMLGSIAVMGLGVYIASSGKRK